MLEDMYNYLARGILQGPFVQKAQEDGIGV